LQPTVPDDEPLDDLALLSIQL